MNIISVEGVTKHYSLGTQTVLALRGITFEIQKGQLNEFLMDIQMMKKPPRHNGMEIKLKFISYENKGKPTFIIFANKPEYIHFSYKRFIENQIRQIFEFDGIPLVFKYKR